MSRETLTMTRAEFDLLLDYSCSLPTGTTAGKRWRRRHPYRTGPGIVNTWSIGEYGEAEGDTVPITWYDVRIKAPHVPGRFGAFMKRLGLYTPPAFTFSGA